MSHHEACTKAIAAHAAWKARFRQFMSGEIELDPQTVERNDVCEFGKWLSGDGKRDLPTGHYESIFEAHSAFHKLAAGVVRAKLGGRAQDAEQALSGTGPFALATAKLTMAVAAARDAK